MSQHAPAARWSVRLLTAALVAAGAVVAAPHAGAEAPVGPFGTLRPPLTQELFATAPAESLRIAGGLAFAPNGDLLVGVCHGPAGLHRFGSVPVERHGSLVREETVLASQVGCGLANGPGNTLFSNAGSAGVVQVDPASGATLAGPAGPPGNALGIAYDALGDRFVYAGERGLSWVAADLSAGGVLSVLDEYDGVAMHPSGQYILAADGEGLDVLDRDGTRVQRIVYDPTGGTGVGSDGIAVHAVDGYVVTNNVDGTITRLDFPDDDLTRPPTITLLASGGFRGDLVQVGADACLYVTQDGARYADGTETDEQSIVRICGGFVPPPTSPGADLVALGDGFTSGEGAGRYLPGTDRETPHNACHRSPKAYPALIRLPAGVTLDTRACSRATVADLLSGNAEGNLTDHGQPEPAQVDALGTATRLVTLTIGAEDVGLEDAVLHCVNRHRSPCRAGSALDRQVRARTAALAGDGAASLGAALAAIRDRAPSAGVRVLGYPMLFADGCGSSGCRVGTLTDASGRHRSLTVDPASARWLDGVLARLNSTLRTVAREAGVTWVDVDRTFRGHGLCDDRPWLRPLVVELDASAVAHVAPGSLHPTATGQARGYLPTLRVSRSEHVAQV